MSFHQFCAFLCAAIPLCAALQGPKIVSGKATLSLGSAKMLVETDAKTIIEWDRFSLDAHEEIRFQQFDKNSSVLNRVLGGEPSSLLGTLTSNGKVYLINPNGVLIGPNARIEAASFVGSSLDILDADFLSDLLFFSGDGKGSVVHLGSISCPHGNVALMARQIKNEGRIEAAMGSVALVAGTDVFLEIEGTLIRPQNKEFRTILEKGRNPYCEAIRAPHENEATEIREEGGRIFLSGPIDVSGEQGGAVYLLGEEIALLDQTKIDASGISGGGKVWIGGDFQGSNPTMTNAQTVHVSEKAEIHTDALERGNGGKVIVWSDGATNYEGRISACGGPLGGDGGFVEVSGKRLKFEGVAIAKAPFGNIGSLLLDPTNITITTADSGGSFGGCVGGTNTFTPDSSTTDTIAAATLVSLLNAPCNVTLSTVGSSGAGTGAITVSSAVSWSAATTLTLTASSFISITAAVTNTSASTGFTAMAFTANGVSSGINSGITLGSGGNLTATGGNIILNGTASGSGANNVNGIYFNGGKITTSGGNVTVSGAVTGGSGSSCGILFSTANSIVGNSSAATMTVSGTSSSSGSGSHGVSIPVSWTTSTSGLFTFTNCRGGSGPASHGVRMEGGFVTSGSLTATSNIVGGSGPGSHGFITFTNTAFQVVGTLSVTASTLATGGLLANGIYINNGIWDIGGAGVTTLIGTGSPNSSGPTNGIEIYGNATLINGRAGTVSIAGRVPLGATGTGVGILLSGRDAWLSNTGTVNISGVSFASGSYSHGVSIIEGSSSVSTGRLTFGAAVTDGTVTIEGCKGGSGSASDGIHIEAPFYAGGAIIATNNIISGTGASSIGFNCLAPFGSSGAGDITIIATSAAISGSDNYGISITDTGGLSIAASATMGSAITLIGTPGTATAIGCLLNGPYPISITGTGGAFISSSSGSIGLGGWFSIGSGNFELASACTLFDDSIFSLSGSLAFDSTIDGAFSLNIPTGPSSTTFSGGIGNITPLIDLTVSSPCILTNDVTIATSDGGDVFFGDTINGAHLLSIDADGAITLSGSIGAITSFSASGSSITFRGSTITAVDAITFNSPFILANNASITAGSAIAFTNAISGNKSLSLTSTNSTVSVTGPIDLSGLSGGNLTVAARDGASFTAAISTRGILDGGNVSISSTEGSVAVHDISTISLSGTAGDISLQPSTQLQSGSTGLIPVGFLQLNGTTLSAAGVTNGSISLSGSGRTSGASVATIAGNYLSENSLTFSCATFVMGANEAMTGYGDIAIHASTSATLGDIVALDTLLIDSPSVTLLTRDPIDLLAFDGTFYVSESSHLLSGSTPRFASAVSPSGSHTGLSGASLSDLIYSPDSLSLNFDTTFVPPVPPTPTPARGTTNANFVYAFTVANTQIFDLLPLLGEYWQWPKIPLFCETDDQASFFKFNTFLLENRLKK